MQEQYEFLKQLVETPSVTGTEWAVASLVRERLAEVADEIETDVMGNVHARLRGSDGTGAALVSGHGPKPAPSDESPLPHSPESTQEGMEATDASEGDEGERLTVLLATHMDEIGGMVSYIDDEGFVRFYAVGGVDAGLLPGLRMDVHTRDGETLRGVVGRMPIHLVPADERKSVAPIDKLCIDLGLPAEVVKEKVSIGDTITYGVGFEELGEGLAVSRAFDDKACLYIGVRVMEELAKDRPAADFVLVGTVAEEIGLRGGQTAAFSENPTVALGFDVTHATDYPGVDKAKYGEIKLGAGPVIARGPNINPVVFERLAAAAESADIPFQIEAEPGVTGTDAGAMQVQRGGIATGLVSLALRYMHTPTEVISLADVEGCVKLIAQFVRELEPDVSFVPGM